MRLLAGRLLCMAVIALAAPQPAFSQDQIEIVHFQSLTFPGSLFSPPFMPPRRRQRQQQSLAF